MARLRADMASMALVVVLAAAAATALEGAASGEPAECKADVLLQASTGRRMRASSSSEEAASPRPRIHIVAPTGAGYMQRAAIMQELVRPTMGEQDSLTFVCEAGCQSDASSGALGKVIEMPDSIFPGGRCTVRTGESCSGYELSQMKFVYGLLHEVQRLLKEGGPMPQWWMIKDDDTYVDVDRLARGLKGYERKHTDLVSIVRCPKKNGTRFADTGWPRQIPNSLRRPDFWATGGSGVLLSAALAEKMAKDYANQWISRQAWAIANDCRHYPRGTTNCTKTCYDYQLAWILMWAPGAAMEVRPELFDATCHLGYWMQHIKSDWAQCPPGLEPALLAYEQKVAAAGLSTKGVAKFTRLRADIEGYERWERRARLGTAESEQY
mmetsp:Transcript_29723/g.85298  ORF Transcript_29723/g.85298 Transcript_29723/m.85298 type:complete len:382 (-) Transcript_29723:54-1199(-)